MKESQQKRSVVASLSSICLSIVKIAMITSLIQVTKAPSHSRIKIRVKLEGETSRVSSKRLQPNRLPIHKSRLWIALSRSFSWRRTIARRLAIKLPTIWGLGWPWTRAHKPLSIVALYRSRHQINSIKWLNRTGETSKEASSSLLLTPNQIQS